MDGQCVEAQGGSQMWKHQCRIYTSLRRQHTVLLAWVWQLRRRRAGAAPPVAQTAAGAAPGQAEARGGAWDGRQRRTAVGRSRWRAALTWVVGRTGWHGCHPPAIHNLHGTVKKEEGGQGAS